MPYTRGTKYLIRNVIAGLVPVEGVVTIRTLPCPLNDLRASTRPAALGVP